MTWRVVKITAVAAVGGVCGAALGILLGIWLRPWSVVPAALTCGVFGLAVATVLAASDKPDPRAQNRQDPPEL
jgi:hypothetical protein